MRAAFEQNLTDLLAGVERRLDGCLDDVALAETELDDDVAEPSARLPA